jgi:chromosome segregation ATPase
VNHHPAEIEVPVSKEVSVSEDTFKAIWEKTRAASDLIARLRTEKHSLSKQLEEAENELRAVRTELTTREQEVKRLRAEHLQLLNSNGKSNLSEEEKENLKRKIRDLIAKINSYL